MPALSDARLYLVCDVQPLEWLRRALAGGVDIVQLRSKAAPSDDALLRAAEPFREAASEAGALFVLNDRPDLVARVGADGVHVGQEDMPVAEARAIVGPDAIVGLSTHAPAQLEAARATPCDYVCAGPVHATPTKPGRPATGLEYAAHAAREWNDPRPWFAIGGLTLENVGEVLAAGATRIVVVRAITAAGDPGVAAAALRGALESGAS